MLIQMAAAMHDAVSLPWPVVRSALAISMTDIEEGRLSWADSMQWSLNRISNSQLAMHNTQSDNSSAPKIRICRYFNEGTCSSEGHHGTYKHFCNFCYKQGRSLGTQRLGVFITMPITIRIQSFLQARRYLVDPWTTPTSKDKGLILTVL